MMERSSNPDAEEARLAQAVLAMAPVVNRYDEVLGRDDAPRRLWQRAVEDVQAGNLDDRSLYWARLRLRRELSGQGSLTDIERQSRGFTVGVPGDDRVVLVTGFDPFHLGRDIHQSNPSGVVVLALHGTVIRGVRVLGAILPVRFADFDHGIVEELCTPVFERGVELGVTVSMGRDAFDLERFPGRRRSSENVDNRGVAGGGTARAPYVPPGLDGPEFLEFSLPVKVMAAVAGRWPTRDNRTVSTLRRGEFDAHSLVELTGEVAVRGSGGGYLSNEIAYRSLLLHRRRGCDFPVGHVHMPALRGHDAATLRDMVEQVRGMVAAALASTAG